jgi:hypothetical protein
MTCLFAILNKVKGKPKKKKGSEMGIQTASSSLSERLWMIKIGITNLEHRDTERERERERESACVGWQ